MNIHICTSLSDYSLLDGLGTCSEYATRAKELGNKYLTISDHGVLSAVPILIRESEKRGLKYVIASELYYCAIQPEIHSLADMKRFMKDLNEDELRGVKQAGAHVLAIAYNEEGYKNLVKLTSYGWVKGFYKRPRVNKEQLVKHKEGIIFTSCCYASPVGKAWDFGLQTSPEYAEELALKAIEEQVSIFGRENYYLEMILLDFPKQKPYNKFLVKASQLLNLKMSISCDTHYCRREDSKIQQLMLMIQTGRTIQEIEQLKREEEARDLFELQDTNLWMKSEEEINEKYIQDYQDIIPLEVFQEAKRNTVRICEKAGNVKLDRSLKLPIIESADEKLWDEMLKGFKKRGLPKTRQYSDRMKEEYNIIWRKGFSSYFLIQRQMVQEARRVVKRFLGWEDPSSAVGFGRGSASSSLTCYLLEITEIDPIKEGLLFSRFMSESRGGRNISFLFGGQEPISVGV